MKKTIAITLLFFALLPVSGQIAVESFRKLETDLTAITAGTQETDQNGEVAALIKIVTTQKGFTFDGGMLGIVKVVQQPAEIWVYVPRKLQKISIAHPDLGMLRDYYFPVPIEGGRSYEMRLSTGQMTTIVKKKLTETAELVIRVTPPDAVLFLDGEMQRLDTDGTFKKVVTVGQHDYRIEAVGYRSVAGTVEVKEDGNEPLVISMKSSLSSLTLACADTEAEILLNGESKGTGRWTGDVPPGTYVVEARRAGHAPTREEIKIDEREELTISVAAPTPLYGKLRVESEPAGATVYVDGVRCGVTPCNVENLAQLLIGEHKVRIEKKDYDTYTTTVTLEQDKETVLSGIRLTQSFYFTIDSKPHAKLYIDGKAVGRTPYSDTLIIGDHRIRLEQKKYEPFEKTVTLSASNPHPVFKLRQMGFPKTQFYIGAEAGVGGLLSASGVVGAYVQDVNAELRFRYPFAPAATAYFNWLNDDGTISDSADMNVACGNGFSAMLGYGIHAGRQLRITPSAGLRYTSITGTSSSKEETDQKTYVLSYVGAVKAEFAISPNCSLVVTPEYSSPSNKDSFISVFEKTLPAMRAWYGGFAINAGIHINF